MRDESAVRRNDPIIIAEIDGITITTRILPINQADEWLAQADKVDALHTKAELRAGTPDQREARRAFNAALLDCICAYGNLKEHADRIRAGMTGEQAIEVFISLREMSDPFEAEKTRTQRAVMDMMTKLPAEVVTEALRISSQGSPGGDQKRGDG